MGDALMTPELPIERFSVFATGVDHPECVAFDSEGNLWAGGEAGQIYRINSEGQVQLIISAGGFSGGLAFSPNDELFVCNPVHGVLRVGRDGSFTCFASEANHQKLICPNFGLFDREGNYYLSDSGQFRKRNGRILKYDAQGRAQQLGGPVGYANGMALSADGQTLFWIESDTNSVFSQRLHQNGTASPPEQYATDCGRFPDGLALDSEGNLYVSCYASDEIWRIDGRGNKTLFAWDPWAILLGSPTNMAFGGKQMDEIYVANLARTTITRAKVPCRGLPLPNRKS
jgi:gluconolactonase